MYTFNWCSKGTNLHKAHTHIHTKVYVHLDTYTRRYMCISSMCASRDPASSVVAMTRPESPASQQGKPAQT